MVCLFRISLCLALPCLLHLLPGLQARSWVSACLFLSLSSLFGWLPSTVDISLFLLASKTFFFRVLLSSMASSGILCDPLLPLLLLCSMAGFAGLLIGYLQLLPLCIGVSRAFQRLVFSISQYLELILQLKYEGSLYCKVSQLLHVRVLRPAPTGYGIPQLQLPCGVVVTSCSSSSSHSGVWQWSPPYPVDYQVVNLVLVSSIKRVLGQLVDVSVWKERPSNDKIKGGLDVQ